MDKAASYSPVEAEAEIDRFAEYMSRNPDAPAHPGIPVRPVNLRSPRPLAPGLHDDYDPFNCEEIP